jgi:peptidoglycan/xylan/chitin deacetylase (PgdA/CDA1 family)
LVSWSARGYDGRRGQTPEAIVERVARTITGGAIVMLHDAAEPDDYEPAAVRALPRLLAVLDRRGLTSIGLDALLSTAD